MKATPSPAITACLMVSLLLISMPMRGVTPAVREQLSISARVPEPGSRMRNVSPAEVLSRSLRLARQAVAGGRDDDVRMIADQARVHIEVAVGGRPITAMSSAKSRKAR